jgi:hypothetical protein
LQGLIELRVPLRQFQNINPKTDSQCAPGPLITVLDQHSARASLSHDSVLTWGKEQIPWKLGGHYGGSASPSEEVVPVDPDAIAAAGLQGHNLGRFGAGDS